MSEAGGERWGVAYGAVAVLAVLLCSTELADPDLGFHLATGREVLANGIPSTNVLSFTNPEHPWVVHQWLSATVFELARSAAGVWGLFGLRATVVATTWLLVLAACRALGAARSPALVAVSLAMGAAAMRFTLRPHLFTALFFALVLWWWARTRASDDPPMHGAVVYAAVLGVAYQFHAGALTIALALLALGVGGIAERGERTGRRDVRGALVGLVAGMALAAGTLLAYHPAGLSVLAVPFDLGGSEVLRRHVVEYRALWELPFEHVAFAWLLLAATVCIVPFWRRIPPGLLLMVGGMAFLALRHVRMVDALAIAAAPALAFAFGELASRASAAGRRLVPVLAFAVATSAVASRWSLIPPGVRFNEHVFAKGLFDFVERHGLQGRAFVTNGIGGPYLARFYPERKVFFDPRFEAYPPEFVTDVYRATRYGEPGWSETLDRWEIDVAILEHTTPGERRLQEGRPNLRQQLAASPDWFLVHFDDVGAVFVRRGSMAASEVAALELPAVDPDRLKVFAPDIARPGLQRLGREAPSLRLLEMVGD